MAWTKRNKFNAVSCTYNGNIYHSRAEAGYAAELDLRLKAKDIASWERQQRIDLKAYGKHMAYYYIDFVVTHNDGGIEYVEVKGLQTPLWRLKWKLFVAQMEETEPDATLTIKWV